MEIEAKFLVADATTFRRLKSTLHLGAFALSKGKTKRVRDTYLDTRQYALLAAGYACRRRRQGRKLLLTVKELGGPEESITKREELEVGLKKDSPPALWPPGPVRDLVLSIAGREPLLPLFELDQTRVVRLVTRNKRTIAELSLDRVRVAAAERLPAYLQVECEIKGDGTEGDLKLIADSLKQEWKLQPDTRSKFERALASLSAPEPARG